MADLPTLNTSGIDITGTLKTVNALRHNDMLNKNLQSEIDYRVVSQPSLIAERESQNALRQIQLNKTAAEATRENLKDKATAFNWIAGLPDEDKPAAYENLRNVVISEYESSKNSPIKVGLHPLAVPKLDAFYKTDNGVESPVWDNAKFSNFITNATLATTSALNPKEGDLVHPIMENSKFDPRQPESVNNPKLIKMTLQTKSGKLVPVEGVTPEPVVDPIEKEKEAERLRKSIQENTEAYRTVDLGLKTKAEERKEILSPNDKRILDEKLVGAAVVIGKDPTSEKAIGAADFHNNYATGGTTMYLTEKNARYIGDMKVPLTESTEVKKIELPTNSDGVQLTQEQVRAYAKKKNVSVQKVLHDIQLELEKGKK